jgi:hypothetical protein
MRKSEETFFKIIVHPIISICSRLRKMMDRKSYKNKNRVNFGILPMVIRPQTRIRSIIALMMIWKKIIIMKII